MKTCKKKIQSIHPDLLESILGLVIRDLIYTMELILTSMITLGFGGFVVTVKEWVTRLTGLFETYKKMGFDIEMIDTYKQNLIGSATILIEYADNIVKKAKSAKTSKFDESAGLEITGEEYMYLEECMKDIDHLCKMSGITSPSTSVKEGEDAFIFEGYDEGSENSTPFFEEGDKTIDEDIRPIVEKLNSKGYKTVASCSGHPSARAKDDRYRDGVRYKKLYSTARIVFDKIYDFPNIPDGWTKKVM